jgi:hypothetical protein
MNTTATTPYPRRPSIPTEFIESGLSVDPKTTIPAKVSLLYDRQLSLNLKAFLLILLSTCSESFSVKDLRAQLEGKIKEDPSRIATYLKMLRKHGYAKKLYYRTKHTKKIAGALWLFTQERNIFPDDETLNKEMERWGLEILPNSDMSEEIPIWEELYHWQKNQPYGEKNTHMVISNSNANVKEQKSQVEEEWEELYHWQKNQPYGKKSTHMVTHNTSISISSILDNIQDRLYRNTKIREEKNKKKNKSSSFNSATSKSDKLESKAESTNKLEQRNNVLQSSELETSNQSLDSKDRPITPSMFNEFWSRYPKKVDRGKCQTIWERICRKKSSERPTWGTIIDALEAQKKSERWSDPKFIPHPSTWLNQKRWLDDPAEMKLFNYDSHQNARNTRVQPLSKNLGTGWTGYYDQSEIRAQLEGIVMQAKIDK